MQQNQKESYDKLQSYVEQFKKGGFVAEGEQDEAKESKKPKKKEAALTKVKVEEDQEQDEGEELPKNEDAPEVVEEQK